METRAAKKRRLIEEENKRNGRRRDRFSDLPDEISHHILSFLPMKSIAQVSATSKRWRSLWASFPILDFSEVCPLTFPFFQNKSVGQIYDQQLKVVRFISSVLSRRHENSNIRDGTTSLLDRAGCSEEQFWESQAQTLSPFLCHLKLVNLRVADPMHVVDVARFLLKHGKELQEMVIRVNKAYTIPAWEYKISIIEGLPRASDVKLSCLIN
ncbi:hypothetical protein L3X38_019702 [Prunus dulcis]|uniref:F-box domain-containing protein n=1 Tax=Prunus dulcis TaxID=3755 RepID=A0AAD4WBI6_PRUDU|nr:hypothetical protein L3X38_019702 [Prunus dulcis]